MGMIEFSMESLRSLETFVGDRRTLRLCALLSLIATIVIYTIPYICGQLLNIMIDNDSKGMIDVNLIVQVCTLVVLMIVMWYVAMTESKHRISKISLDTSKRMREEMNSRMMKAPISFLESMPPGDLSSRFTNDLPAVTNLISSDYTGFITHFTMLIAIIVMMFITSPIMAILYILIVPVIIILVKHLTNESQEGFERQKTMISDLNTQMNDIISSHKSIKVDDLEKRMMDDFKDSNRRFTDAYFTSHSRSGMIKPVIGTMVNVGYLIVVIAGAILLVKDLISVGMFLTFMIYVRIVTGPIMTTSNIYNGMRDRMLSLNRVMEILNAPIEEHDGNERIDIKGRVEFKDVTFHYRDGPDVLHSVSFTIEPGRMTALVGATASGKTTISNILMGFYQPSSGTIEIDGVNRNDIDQDILHRSMASVLQDPWMFDGTLRENIIYNRPWISEEEMLKVSRFVGLDDFVLRLPMGYDTPVNEEILKLPLAQRRMLAMARALIGDPKIIVLDESVAGIDPISGQTIIEGLKKFSKDRTVILITHNQAVIDQADDVIHILDGRIVD